jgi:murein L,D-transpeptidase YafK
MRIRMLTGSAAVFFSGILFLQAAAKPLHADRVVALKGERTLELLSQGKVTRSYKVALGGDSEVFAGGKVFVHGLPNGYGWVGSSHRMKDWTDGCIAVTNAEIDEIWAAVTDGTPIEIRL